MGVNPARAAATSVASGYAHACAVLTTGVVQCWGRNSFGALGNGSNTTSLVPVPVTGIGNATAVAVGEAHSCALIAGGTVRCWGYNTQGQLGNGSLNHSNTPVTVVGVSNATAVSTGQNHSCAMLATGSVQCWGFNGNGRLGNGTATSTTTAVTAIGITSATAISAGDAHTCALLSSGSVSCWGWGGNARLGTASNSSTLQPQPVVGITSAQAVSAGFSHTCAVLRDGSVSCWGGEFIGLLGPGSSASSGPVAVPGVSNASTVSAGLYHTCVQLSTGSLQCWGDNTYGQLGNGNTSSSTSAVTVSTISNATSVSARVSFTCAVLSSGVADCWGYGGQGQLGRASTSNSSTPVNVLLSSASGVQATGLTVSGPANLQSEGRASVTATATFNDGSTRVVVPVWTSSQPAAALVSNTGILAAGRVNADTLVTLTARYTDNGVTQSASLQVLIKATASTLLSLRLADLAGGTNISMQSGGQLRLVTTATYSDGSAREVPATSYVLTNAALGAVNSRGVLVLASVNTGASLGVTANYREGTIQTSASIQVAIQPAASQLRGLSLVGARANVNSGASLSLSALGVYIDGSRKPVNATWQIDSSAATLSNSGVLTATSVSQNTPALVTASYTEGGVTVSAEFRTVVLAMAAAASPIAAEVDATGTRSSYSLSVWSSVTGASAAPALAPRTTSTSGPYKLYVVALLPSGALVAQPTLFVLNRNREWQTVSSPVAEYLDGVLDDSVLLVDIFDELDVTLLTGADIYLGYGTDEAEMISAGRYTWVYQMP